MKVTITIETTPLDRLPSGHRIVRIVETDPVQSEVDFRERVEHLRHWFSEATKERRTK